MMSTLPVGVSSEEAAPAFVPLARSPAQALLRGKAVVVHGGARDSYQLALALAQADLLDALVTDLFWPRERAWAQWMFEHLPPHYRELVLRRSAEALPSEKVVQHVGEGLRGILLDRWPGASFSMRRRSNRAADAALGRSAGRRARKTGSGLVAYSYFGYHAMSAYGAPAMLFQVHPHPETMRRVLREELEAHPECAASLEQEWELALPEPDFLRLVEEPRLASHLLVASSFTRETLVEQGMARDSIDVVPYGVDLDRFHPAAELLIDSRAPLRLLFVGRINQRKGIHYLLQALSHFSPEQVRLTVCGRVVDDLELFRPFARQVEIRPSVSSAALVQAYQAADLFVFPSVAEGFGQVLLEALACGLPILSTTRTAAPDLIHDGVEGFIVQPGSVEQLAEKIAWAASHRDELANMRVSARRCAEQFTWQRFREAAAASVRKYLSDRALEMHP